mmetsp:Transcript_13485/g.16916  ORF Transcript_13485/g.16916 Transcript_13485/m.16916 type:complete len:193 (-) Transcript_13485:436-1014(-)
MRSMDREIRNIQAAEKKSEAECQKLAKQGRIDACKIIAKEIYRTRATINRMYQNKAQMNSISMQLTTQASLVRAAGSMKRSSDVMAAMNKLVNVPQLQKTMIEMQREMQRAGLIDDMVNDAMESLDGDEIEEESENQINSIVAEITGDIFNEKDVNNVPTSIPQSEQSSAVVAEENKEADDLDAMKARLHAL